MKNSNLVILPLLSIAMIYSACSTTPTSQSVTPASQSEAVPTSQSVTPASQSEAVPIIIKDDNGKHTLKTSVKKPFAIGILADTQIQTTTPAKQRSLLHNNSKLADEIIPVAIRPPLLNHFAPQSIDIIHDKINVSNPDIFIYLGDALNNGCAEEFERFEEKVNMIKKPIFITIGNHDYLGAGNYSNEILRKDLCDKILSKKDYLDKISKINQRSYDELKKMDNQWGSMSHQYVCKEGEPMDIQEDCFYSHIIYNENYNTALIILDTSDYQDYGYIKIIDWSTSLLKKSSNDELKKQLELYKKNKKISKLLQDEIDNLLKIDDLKEALSGSMALGLKGGLSEKQVNWVSNQLKTLNWANGKHHLRIFASHYKPANLTLKGSTFESKKHKVGNIFDMMHETNDWKNIDNLYLSAHTHASTPPEIKHIHKVGNDNLEYTLIEVGSTTDYSNYGYLLRIEQDKVSTSTHKIFIETEEEEKEKLFISVVKNLSLKRCFPSNTENVWEINFGLSKGYASFNEEQLRCLTENFKTIDSSNHNKELVAFIIHKAAKFESLNKTKR